MDGIGFAALLSRWARVMEDSKEELIRLDGLCGDSDLGLTMSAGFAAAAQAVDAGDERDIGKLSYLAGKAMASAVPSTMGTLMASGLINAGKALRGRETLDVHGQAVFFRSFYDGVRTLGKAEPGDKTFLDGLKPALDAIEEGLHKGQDIVPIAQSAALAAQRGYERTQGMLAKHGRMAIRGDASRAYLDPGAAVAALLVRAWADQVTGG